MSDQTSKTSDSIDLKQSPRLTMRRLEGAESIELKPMSLDEFDAAVSARTPSTPVVKLEPTTKPASPTKPSNVAPNASTGYGDFGAEVERRVRRSAPSAVPASTRSSSDAASARRVNSPVGSPYNAKATQSAPRPSATNASKPAEQPIFKPTAAAPAKPASTASSNAATKPATPRFDTKTGKPLASAQNSPASQPQRQKSSGAPTPRFDPKTGKPLAVGLKNPFVNPSAVNPQKQKSPSPTIPRFDPKTGKPLAAGQKASNDLYGGLSKEEFEKLHKAAEAPSQPKKKAPQIGCLPAIVIVGVFAALFQETGVFIGVFGIFVVNAILKALFGGDNPATDGKEDGQN